LLSAFDLAPFGYATEEFFVSGTATSYRTDAPTEDGQWIAAPANGAAYHSRMVVVRPTDAHRFNGIVVVEWFNVTAGVDASPDWNMTHREILRSGYAYVGVSAQQAGIDGPATSGGMSFAQGLKKMKPERYGELNHPGDAYSYDIYSQAGHLLRTATTTLLGPLLPRNVLAIGESQSAARMTTYINAIDPIARIYDGFLVHSRFGGSAPLHGTGMGSSPEMPRFVKFRSDLRVPVMTVETETDVVGGNLPGYHGARVADSDKLRVWELAGSAHADNYSFAGMIDSGTLPIQKLAAAWAPMVDLPVPGGRLAKAINNAPQQHYVTQAALVALSRWVSEHRAPAQAPVLKTNGAQHDRPLSFVTDANGVTAGGVRTPWVEVPVARTSGTGNSGNALASLVGTCEPFDDATLDRLYPGGKSEYLEKFEASLDESIKSGFLLAADKQEIIDLASAGYQPTPTSTGGDAK
jgi:hypothetical protein